MVNRSQAHLIDPEYEFIGAIIKQGIEELGPEYARCPDGIWWMSMVGLVPDVVWRMAGGKGKWKESSRCRCRIRRRNGEAQRA